MSSIEAELQELYFTLRQMQLGGLSAAAALTWVTYDTIVTLQQEVEYIWKAKWTMPKGLYIGARYFALATIILRTVAAVSTSNTVNFCKAYIWVDAFVGMIAVNSIVSFIFLLRLNALYGARRAVLAFLFLCWLAELVIDTVNTALAVRQLVTIPAPLGIPFPGCLAQEFNGDPTLATWITSLAVATIFFLLTIYKVAQNMLVGGRNVRPTFSRQSPYRIMTVFLRDGTVFFAMMVAVLVINLAVILAGGPTTVIVQPWLGATFSVAGSRLILNLKSLSASPTETATLNAESFARLPKLRSEEDIELDMRRGRPSDATSAARFATPVAVV